MKRYTHAVRSAQAGESAVLGAWHGKPRFEIPPGACDSHVHVFGPRDRYPLAGDRTFAPGVASVQDIVALHQRLGIERAVLVQASPQGTDNSCLLDALKEFRDLGRQARAVVVLPDIVSTQELQSLRDLGVRGLRVNLQSYGRTDPEQASLRLRQAGELAARMRWHVQIYTTLSVIASIAESILRLPVPLVVDHFALADPAAGLLQPGLLDLIRLVREGRVYVKLSAPYRIVDRVDGQDGAPIARALIDANAERMLWGTDWPHTGPWPGLPRDRDGAEPFHPVDDGAQLDIFCSWTSSAERRQILVDNAASLYGF